VPTWRATKDISIKDDLAEEVGRMIGYDSITPESPLLPAIVPPASEFRNYVHEIRQLVAARGFDEVYNYSFLSDALAQQFGLKADEHVRVLNPIAVDQALLRKSLVPGIWKNIIENSKYSDEFRLFEIGHEIHKRDGDLPSEANHIVAVVYYNESGPEGLFELKCLAECIAGDLRFRPAEPRSYEHPARTAAATLGGEQVGRLFEFHPSFVHGRASVLDLDLDAVMRLSRRERRYQPIRRFPSSSFDLSVIADSRALVGEIQEQLEEQAETDFIEFVRQYAGPPLPEGKKSVSFRITVSAPDRTLSSEEIGEIRARMIEGMRGLGYDLRV
jgi:phenylalanyl-tRNA synthetase beta chain